MDLYPEIKFYSAAFDSAYDTNAYYNLNMHYGINPIIDLNSRRRSTTERCWDRINNDFHAEDAIIYSIERRITRVFLGAFCCFIDAWACEKQVSIAEIFPMLRYNIA